MLFYRQKIDTLKWLHGQVMVEEPVTRPPQLPFYNVLLVDTVMYLSDVLL